MSATRLKLDPLEIVALRGMQAREVLAQIQTAQTERDIDVGWATIYGTIEARLGLPTGAILRNEARIEGDVIVLEGSECKED